MKLQRLGSARCCATDSGNPRRFGQRPARKINMFRIIGGGLWLVGGAECARRRGGEAKPPEPSAIMRCAEASLGKGSDVGSADHGR